MMGTTSVEVDSTSLESEATGLKKDVSYGSLKKY